MNSKERCLAALAERLVDRARSSPLLTFSAASRFAVDAITACSDAFRMSADLGGDMAYPDDQPPVSPIPW